MSRKTTSNLGSDGTIRIPGCEAINSWKPEIVHLFEKENPSELNLHFFGLNVNFQVCIFVAS